MIKDNSVYFSLKQGMLMIIPSDDGFIVSLENYEYRGEPDEIAFRGPNLYELLHEMDKYLEDKEYVKGNV